jgi:hypothetical protein
MRFAVFLSCTGPSSPAIDSSHYLRKPPDSLRPSTVRWAGIWPFAIGYGEFTPEEYANGTNPMFGLKSRGPNVKLIVTTSTKQGTSPLVQTGPKLSSLNKQLSKAKSRTFDCQRKVESSAS